MKRTPTALPVLAALSSTFFVCAASHPATENLLPAFFPVSGWYAGGRVRAPMLKPVIADSRHNWRRDLEKNLRVEDLQTHKLVIVPYPILLTAPLVDILDRYVRDDGHLFVETRPRWVNERFEPELLETFGSGTSLYKALAEHYGIEMAVADEVVEAGPATPEEARLLETNGQPVEFVKSVYRADRYKIVNRLTRVNRELLPMVRVS